MLQQIRIKIVKWLRSLWRRKATNRPRILKEWYDRDKGRRCIKITRGDSPTAIATYRFMLVGDERQLYLFVDSIPLYRRSSTRKHISRTGTDPILEGSYNYCVSLLWNHYDKHSNRSVRENVGLYCVGIEPDKYNRTDEMIADKIAYKIFSLSDKDFYNYFKRFDPLDLINTGIRSAIGNHRAIFIKRVD